MAAATLTTQRKMVAKPPFTSLFFSKEAYPEKQVQNISYPK